MMTREQFNEACGYANERLDDWEVDYALDSANNRNPLTARVRMKLQDAMDEWCEDHDINPDEWRKFGNEEDVFFNNEGGQSI